MLDKTSSSNESIAVIHYGHAEFAVLKAGSHVRCAVSGELIAVQALKYWCPDRQEAYAGPAEATRRLAGKSGA